LQAQLGLAEQPDPLKSLHLALVVPGAGLIWLRPELRSG
jgi:hypothetical protein